VKWGKRDPMIKGKLEGNSKRSYVGKIGIVLRPSLRGLEWGKKKLEGVVLEGGSRHMQGRQRDLECRGGGKMTKEKIVECPSLCKDSKSGRAPIGEGEKNTEKKKTGGNFKAVHILGKGVVGKEKKGPNGGKGGL